MSGKMIAGAAVATVAGMLPNVTQAAPLTIDLRLNPASSANPKLLQAVVPNLVVTLDMYAIIENGDANRTNDGFQSTEGSMKSLGGAVLGNYRGDTGTPLTQSNNVSPFKFATATAGVLSDLDGDGDFDLGSNITSGSFTPDPFFEATTDSGTSPQLGTGTTGNQEFLIGQFLFTVTSGPAAATSLNYFPRVRTDGGVNGPRLNKFRVDGVDYNVNAAGAGVKNLTTVVSGAMVIGDPVLLGLVPEPASLGLLGSGAAALLRRRKA